MLDDLVALLREMAVRSLALAVRAREEGHDDLSEELIASAAQCERRASAIEAMPAKPSLQ